MNAFFYLLFLFICSYSVLIMSSDEDISSAEEEREENRPFFNPNRFYNNTLSAHYDSCVLPTLNERDHQHEAHVIPSIFFASATVQNSNFQQTVFTTPNNNVRTQSAINLSQPFLNLITPTVVPADDEPFVRPLQTRPMQRTAELKGQLRSVKILMIPNKAQVSNY